MSITEIAVALITTGPAYALTWWTIRKDTRTAAPTCSGPHACGQRTADSEVSAEDAPGPMRTWALAA
jgi:hypothetical protein